MTSIPSFCIVVGVDRRHLRQLGWTWPTWKRHKPSLLSRHMIIFYDQSQVGCNEVLRIVDHPHLDVVPWSPTPASEQSGNDKWSNPQRVRMLAGFLHVPAKCVETPYWLKIDTDVVATDRDDWIDPTWFDSDPAIVSHRWTFTRPPDQMDRLDQWAEDNRDVLPRFPTGPLNLHPQPGATRLGHKRIISFVGFFNTEFTRQCAEAAAVTVGRHRLPEGSQDGYTWYMAKRLDRPVVITNMKSLKWQQWSSDWNVEFHAEEALKAG